MRLYTPRGLKIRLPVPYVFALMRRLYPRYVARQVLTTTEAIAEIPSLLCNLALLITLFARAPIWESMVAPTAALLLGEIVVWNGLFVVPGVPTMALLWSYPPSLLRVFVIAGLGCLVTGWRGPLAVLLAHSLASVARFATELLFARLRSKPRLTVTLSEMCFFDAYNLYASKVGAVTRALGVTDLELDEHNWISLYREYVGSLSDPIRKMMEADLAAHVNTGSDLIHDHPRSGN